MSKSTTFIIHVVEEEETRSCYGSNLLISNGTDLEFFSEFDAAPTVHNKTSSVWEPSGTTPLYCLGSLDLYNTVYSNYSAETTNKFWYPDILLKFNTNICQISNIIIQTLKSRAN